MDFGKVNNVDEVDFTLPPDHEDTTRILAQAKKLEQEPEVFVGCAKWGRKDWIGKIYPKGTKDKDFLAEYAKHFKSIELNATHYRIPPEDWVEKWNQQVGEDFKFCPKVHQMISHRMWLKNAEGMTDAFTERMQSFGNRLGLTFLQLNPRFSPKKLADLENYLHYFPKEEMPLALELRHHDWFDGSAAANETFHMLRENGVSTVITDASGEREVLHQRLTTPIAFIRFVGNSLHPTDYTRIDDWVERINSWLAQGLKTLYFFMHQHEEIDSPVLCTYLIKQLNKKCGLNLHEPELIEEK